MRIDIDDLYLCTLEETVQDMVFGFLAEILAETRGFEKVEIFADEVIDVYFYF